MDTSGTASPNSEAGDRRLAELAYETTVQPGTYDQLLSHWDGHIRRLLLPDGAEPLTLELDPDLARHFARAFQVFERIGRPQQHANEELDIHGLVAAQAGCALAFDVRGELVAANPAARRLLDLSSNPTISELPIDGLTRAGLRDALSSVRSHNEPQPLVLRDLRDRPLVLMASPASPPGVVLANAVDGQWSATTERLLDQGFAITTAELALIRGLYEGKTLRQIAEQRSRSIGTIRTQLKTVQQKTGAHSQIELMRLVIGLIFASNTEEAAVEDSHQNHTAKSGEPSTEPESIAPHITLADGRILFYEDIGSPSATNVAIFLHGMLDTPSLPDSFIARLRENNTRCLCIHRPGYGASDPYTTEAHLGELFTADLKEFMDVLNISQAVLIGHLSGGVLACIAASVLTQRILAVVNINGGVPIVSRQQFEVMTPRQRVIALTAKYTPKALPLLLRAGIALLDSGGERSFMRELHRNSPRDHRLTQRPDVFEKIAQGFQFAVAQGHHTFLRESALVVSNWDSYIDNIACPVTLLHGEHDGVIAIQSVRDLIARHPKLKLIEFPDYGQLMLYGYPNEIATSLIEALRGAAPNHQRSAS